MVVQSTCFYAVILLEYGAIRSSWRRDVGSTVYVGVGWGNAIFFTMMNLARLELR